MKMTLLKFSDLCRRWQREENAAAALEAAFVCPVLLVILRGTFEMGNGILANQKTIRASQVTADLITRGKTIDDDGIDEAITAGQLAFEPLDSSSVGVDVVSISFDSQSHPHIE